MTRNPAHVSRHRRPRRTRTVAILILAAAAVCAVLATAAVRLLGHRDSERPELTVVPASSEAAGVGPLSSLAPTEPPDATVADLTWVGVAGARVPTSPSAGPHDVRDGRARGFARSALGAVLAAVHISVRLCPQVGPGVFTATLREQVVGAGSVALGQHLDEDYQQTRAQLGLAYGQPAGRLYTTAYGYRVESADSDTATVRLLIEGPGAGAGSVLVALTMQLLWTGEDWSLVAPVNGDWGAQAFVTSDTTGIIRFPGGG